MPGVTYAGAGEVLAGKPAPGKTEYLLVSMNSCGHCTALKEALAAQAATAPHRVVFNLCLDDPKVGADEGGNTAPNPELVQVLKTVKENGVPYLRALYGGKTEYSGFAPTLLDTLRDAERRHVRGGGAGASGSDAAGAAGPNPDDIPMLGGCGCNTVKKKAAAGDDRPIPLGSGSEGAGAGAGVSAGTGGPIALLGGVGSVRRVEEDSGADEDDEDDEDACSDDFGTDTDSESDSESDSSFFKGEKEADEEVEDASDGGSDDTEEDALGSDGEGEEGEEGEDSEGIEIEDGSEDEDEDDVRRVPPPPPPSPVSSPDFGGYARRGYGGVGVGYPRYALTR